MKRVKKIILLLIAFSIITGCSSKKEEESNFVSSPYKRTEFLMGTVVTVKIYDKKKEKVLEDVFSRIEILADQITVNEEGSVIDDINNQAGKTPVKVSEDIFRLVKEGIGYSQYSGGVFDITIGPLTSLWSIGFPEAKVPTQEEIDQVLPLIDVQQIELNEDEQTVFLKKEGMKLDLGGIAKGFIADEVEKVLEENDVRSAIIDLGGNIYVKGQNPSGRAWEVGVQNPFSARGEMVGKMKQENASIVTSGIYERYLEKDGVKYHHILSPINGYPVNNEVVGITIVSDTSFDGDGLSTTMFIKGIEEGLKAVEKLDGIEAIFVSNEKKIYVTSGLKDNFQITNDEFQMGN